MTLEHGSKPVSVQTFVHQLSTGKLAGIGMSIAGVSTSHGSLWSEGGDWRI